MYHFEWVLPDVYYLCAHKAFLFDVSKISICMAFGHFLAAGLKLKSLRLESSRRINISADPPAL